MSSDNEARSRRVVVELFSSLQTESQNHGVVPLPFLVSDGIRVEIWNAASMVFEQGQMEKESWHAWCSHGGVSVCFFFSAMCWSLVKIPVAKA